MPLSAAWRGERATRYTPRDATEFADAMTAWIMNGDGAAVVLDPNGTRVTVLFASDDATLETLRGAAS